ncbi:MAG: hybrid sensor histidine kinase/response regulator [Paracoccus sp. (in: a-proteobacteria)]|nr:hybrid sensor histidine kinase/response regulator [Paracoccus sp. (in: a-proteobacteria)]
MLRDDDSLERRLQKLERINEALIERIDLITSRRGSAWSVFQAAVALEQEVAARNRDLEKALQNLSERNRELAIARASAEEANRSKTRFLRAASHDLIQPIAAAKLFLEALGDTEQSPIQQELTARLNSAFVSVEELMDSVLEIARLDSQRIQFNRQPVDLAVMLARLAGEFAPMAAAKGLDLRVLSARLTIDSDPVFIRRIAQNLIANAIKYTPQGRVLVGMRRSGGRAWLEVHDTGVGIDIADRNRIFDEFQRLTNDGVAGMGLGLSIVRRACARLGHPIKLDSTRGRGTVFRVGLPIVAQPGAVVAAPEHQPAAPSGAGLAGLRAIVVENDHGLRRAYEIMLSGAFGMTVHGAGSSAEAIALADTAPDIVLADYNLDGGDCGLVAIAGLREALGGLPALVVTAQHDDDTARACAALGVPVLEKPVDQRRLRAAMENAISEQR